MTSKPKKQKPTTFDGPEQRHVLGEVLASAEGQLDNYRRGSRLGSKEVPTHTERDRDDFNTYVSFVRFAQEVMSRLKRRNVELRRLPRKPISE